MPGPPVRSITTSNSPGFDSQMKVKGTYVLGDVVKWIASRYLFINEEEEAEFFKRNPEVKGFLDLDDVGKKHERDLPYKVKNQKKAGIINEGEKITPKTKPNVKAKPSGQLAKR